MNAWILAVLGGVGLSVSTTTMLALNGQIAGVGGSLARVVQPYAGERGWQALFVVGIVVGGGLVYLVAPQMLPTDDLPRSKAALVVAGLIMGVGGRMANGCMSGHCICGVSRRSKRSIVATVLFMGAAGATVFVITNFLGGRL